MENEIWRQCGNGDRTIYEASNFGNLRSINKFNNRIRILKQTTSSHGYNFIKIKNKNKFTHQLVAIAFHGTRPETKVIDHIDRDKQNNCAANLRYCTHQENMMNTSRYRHDVVGTPYERNLILVSQRMKRYYQRKKKNSV